MKKQFLSMALIIGAMSISQATVVYRSLNFTLDASTSKGLDIDNNNVVDATFMGPDQTASLSWFDTNTGFSPVTINASGGSTTGWDVINVLSPGTLVSEQSIYGSLGDAYINPNWATQAVFTAKGQYIGFKFKIGKEIHYGWAKVVINSSKLTSITEIAYESSPNIAIKVGDIGTVTGLELNNVTKNVNIYPNPAIDNVYFNSNLEYIKVIDLLGNTVRETNSTNSISVSDLPKGIYIVETNEGNARLVH